MSIENFFLDPKDCGNFIGGRWVKGTGSAHPIYSPYHGKLIGQVFHSQPKDVDAVVTHAEKAFHIWSKVPLKERTAVLLNWRALLLEQMDVFAQTISAECGKTLGEAKAELLKGIEVLEFATSLQNLDSGGKMEVSRGVSCEYRREPLGVVVGITPFNFPAMVPMWMIPIALALGNSFVWKPSDKTPLTSLLLAESAQKAGIPDGAFSVVQGGKETVEALLEHPLVQAVGFVGSTAVAQSIYKVGSSHLKRVLALGGAKNHIILMPDADPEMATRGIVDSYTACAGQRCMAASVLVAVGEAERMIKDVVEKSSQILLGKEMGAIISKESVNRIQSAVAKAQTQGATLILDGRKFSVPPEFQEGNWIAPTVLDRLNHSMEISCTEVFGPVLGVIRCPNLTEALAIEQKSPYGNAASIFTSNGAMTQKLIESTRAGMVGINVGVPVPREPFSFGGTGASKFGHGDITGESSLDFWSNLKKVTTRWFLSADRNWMS